MGFLSIAALTGFLALFLPRKSIKEVFGPPVNQAAYGPITRDVDIMARTLWGEARGDGTTSMQAVACVIMNRWRLRRAGAGYASFGPVNASVAQICQQPGQFSCWNLTDPNRIKMLGLSSSDPVFRLCIDIAQSAVSGRLPDITGGADHYHTVELRTPAWARGQTPIARIGSHLFYNITNRGVA